MGMQCCKIHHTKIYGIFKLDPERSRERSSMSASTIAEQNRDARRHRSRSFPAPSRSTAAAPRFPHRRDNAKSGRAAGCQREYADVSSPATQDRAAERVRAYVFCKAYMAVRLISSTLRNKFCSTLLTARATTFLPCDVDTFDTFFASPWSVESAHG